MTKSSLLQLLADVERGTVSPAAATEQLIDLPFEDIGYARVDHHRALRTGLPEVIYAAGKTPEQTAGIFASMAAKGANVLATRVSQPAADLIHAAHPDAAFHPLSGVLTLMQAPPTPSVGRIAVLCAGTSDLPVGEEAALTAESFRVSVTRLYDVGVAGLHRLLAVRDQLATAHAVIVCAGMEGALPSVVGGLVGVPVIAVAS